MYKTPTNTTASFEIRWPVAALSSPGWRSLFSVSSQHTIQVLLCVLLVGGRVLRAVLVVVLEDGHHVVVSEVNRFVHGCVSPPASEGKVSWGLQDLQILHDHNEACWAPGCYLSLGTGLTLQASSRKRTTSVCPETHTQSASHSKKVLKSLSTLEFSGAPPG